MSTDTAAALARPRRGERHYAAHARSIPGYGGHYVDEAGNLHVRLLAAGQIGAARAELAGVLAANVARMRGSPDLRARLAATPQIVPELSEYTWAQLAAWRNALLASVFAIPEVASLDLDEMRGRVTVGVSTLAAEQVVRAAVTRAGVLGGAVLVREQGIGRPVQQAQTLGQKDRPLRGGLTVRASRPSVQSICSVGFNAQDASGRVGFFTAAHCTKNMFAVDTTPFYQPLITADNFVGWELAQGRVLSPGVADCPADTTLTRCMTADAAFVVYQNAANADFRPYPFRGGLALTHDGSGVIPTGYRVSGSLTIQDRLQLVRTANDLPIVIGGYYAKTGQTTGTTRGRVTTDCADQREGTSLLHLCQGVLEGAYTAGGDSGGPVYDWDSDNNATIIGITVRSNERNGVSFTEFVPFANLADDFGALRVFP